MRRAIRSALLTSLLAGLLQAGHAQTLAPNPVPTKLVHNQWVVKVSISGHDGWYLLATNSKTSYRLPRSGESGPDGRTTSATISIGDVDGGSVKFKVTSSPQLKALGVDGALGADALANFTLAIDVEQAQVGVWTDQPSLLGQRGWILLLPVISSATQHAVTLSVDDVDKLPYGVKSTYGDSKGLSVVQLAEPQASIVDGLVSSAPMVNATPELSIVDGVSVAEVGPFWLLAGHANSTPKSGEAASIPVTSLPVRRVVFDGHTGTMITEQLGATGVTSLLLSRLMGIPVEVLDGTLFMRQGGALYGSDVTKYAGATVSAIAGIGADEIVAALGDSSTARLDMLRRLVHARQTGYTLDFVQGGKAFHTTIKPAG